jgi:hypothetical protein
MTSEGASLTWRERVLVAEAKRRGMKISVGTMAEAMTGKVAPSDRVVAAYSIILGVHPDELGFTRTPLTELGYLAFERVYPGDDVAGDRSRSAA